MVFQLARTFPDPGATQRGFPAPGAGAQRTGPGRKRGEPTPDWTTKRWAQGTRTWLRTFVGAGAQRGFPAPESAAQARPLGSMPNNPPVFGGVFQNYTPYYDRGAAAYVPNFGYVLYNPIGAGVAARYRTQASYGPGGSYDNGAIWWTSQAVPTSINLQGLTDPAVLGALLNRMQVQGVVRTTG